MSITSRSSAESPPSSASAAFAAGLSASAAAGFDYHLTKPVDPQVLYGLLQTGKAVDHA